ncbi:MAG TPA: ProQ/FINO family protein [Burkholderiaceae bacterium]|nr:ProQ/FINO family protein [Burkholderiaceae bacterium]
MTSSENIQNLESHDSIDATQVKAASNTASTPPKPGKPKIDVHPVLEKLFELYPTLFGAKFLPLKRGIYQDLMAAHPEVFAKDSLKAALGFHTRSTRYLQCVADGNQRHDLHGQATEDVAPEHVYLSLLELFRRRVLSNHKSKTKLDLRPVFRKQLIAAFKASGLSRQDYQLRVQNKDEEATKLLTEALDEHDAKVAKQTALKQAFNSSGKKAAEFAAMYGLELADVEKLLNKQSQ